MQKRPTLIAAAAIAALAGLPLVGFAGDWPQFMGPTGDGQCTETGIARSWPDSGPRELWSADIGVGFGGAAIRDGEVVILDRRDDKENVLRVFALDSGEELWSAAWEAAGRTNYNGSRAVPTIDDDHIYAAGPFGNVYCVDRKTHKTVWQRNLRSEYGSRTPGFGFSQSPLLYKDVIIMGALTREKGLVAFNKKSGEEVWTSSGIGGGGHSTSGLFTVCGETHAVFVTSSGVFGINPSDGAMRWRYTDYRNRNPIPLPTPIGDDTFFFTGGYNGGSTVAKFTKSGDDFNIETLARIRNGSQIPPALFHDGYLYANLNENGNLRRNRPGLACLDKEGKILWSTGSEPDIERGNLVMIDGLILALGGSDGVLRLIEASPEGYKELASHAVFTNLRRRNNNIWAPLAISNGKLVLRNQSQLKCLDLTGKGGAAPKKPGKKTGGKRKFF